MRAFLLSCFAALALALALPASAATSTSSLTNSASIPASCTISVVSHLQFNYDPLVAHRLSKPTTTGVLRTDCTPGAFQVDVNYGSSANPAWTTTDPAYGMGYYTCNRYMSGPGGALLGYEVRDSAGNYTLWKSGTQYVTYTRDCSTAGWTQVFPPTPLRVGPPTSA